MKRIDVVAKKGCGERGEPRLVYMEVTQPSLFNTGGVRKVVCPSLLNAIATPRSVEVVKVCRRKNVGCCFLDEGLVDVAVLDDQAFLVRRP